VVGGEREFGEGEREQLPQWGILRREELSQLGYCQA